MKDNSLDKGYDPLKVEQRWYKYWEENKLFAADAKTSKKSYSIVIPPPNVTGVLHMGHALNNTMQDILCRYRRLQGDNVLWMPGTDHAGIATQNVVEKKLAKEKTDRHQLGRKKFIKTVWQWRTKYGRAIINQLKRLGASCDWERERFTMDEGLSRAVRKVFVKLYEDGLIYRGNYIINWCHRCNTALSDLEVEHAEIEGHLWHIRYPFADGSGHIIVATTRPETMLGDTAVAVNPNDERYTSLQCNELILPLMNRKIPLIRDKYVDTGFGTGALKITPAHDPNDFEIGERHSLANIKVIGDDGKMNAMAGQFEGLDRFACRELVVTALKQAGLLVKVVAHPHNVGHCYRCKAVVEPNLSKQWFVKTKPLAQKAIAAVENGHTKIIPRSWDKTYFEWMRNIKDWCISRQIWWGHQIPAWTCGNCGKLVVAQKDPVSCPECQSHDLSQETDVLDTWFSSALWPFSTMGWPDNTQLLKTFYPTSVLITGFDILFFWVARMMMMGIYCMKEVPFKDVYVHALVRDEHGKKMSKSKGNVIDPLDIIEKYGTDAFRFTLAAFAAQGRDIKMSEKRVDGYRHFINKLWNAARFALMHISKDNDKIDLRSLALPNQWILSRLSKVTDMVEKALDTYRFNDAAATLYQFVWHEFCDWYLEAAKPALYDKSGPAQKQATRAVLGFVLENTLILLHPFIPFITEEIWHKLPATKGSIMRAVFPSDAARQAGMIRNKEVEIRMDLISEIITAIRNIRGEMNIAPSLALEVVVQTPEDNIRAGLQKENNLISNLAGLKKLEISRPGTRPKIAATAIVGNAEIFVILEGVINFKQEATRLTKEINKIAKELTGVTKKLGNEDFLNKAPEQVVNKVKQKHAGLLEKQQKLEATLTRLNNLNG